MKSCEELEKIVMEMLEDQSQCKIEQVFALLEIMASCCSNKE